LKKEAKANSGKKLKRESEKKLSSGFALAAKNFENAKEANNLKFQHKIIRCNFPFLSIQNKKFLIFLFFCFFLVKKKI